MSHEVEQSSSMQMPLKTILLSLLFIVFLLALMTWLYRASDLNWDWSQINVIALKWGFVLTAVIASLIILFATNTSKVSLNGDEIIVTNGSNTDRIKLVECEIPEKLGSNAGTTIVSMELYRLSFKRKTNFGRSVYFKTNHFFLNEVRYNFASFLKGKIIEAHRIEKGMPPSGRR